MTASIPYEWYGMMESTEPLEVWNPGNPWNSWSPWNRNYDRQIDRPRNLRQMLIRFGGGRGLGWRRLRATHSLCVTDNSLG